MREVGESPPRVSAPSGQSRPSALTVASVPWWLGRGAGLGLLLLAGALLWTFSWSVAARVEALPPVTTPATTPWGDIEVAGSPTSTTAAEVQRSRTRRQPAPAAGEIRLEESGGSDVESLHEPPESRLPTRALRTEMLREREQWRIEQAQRADRQLAEFIAAVGVLDTLGGWVPPISADYRVTAEFGQSGSLWSNDHTGVDLAAPSGTSVMAVAPGTVTHAGEAGAYGLRVEVTHAEGTVTSYSHLSRIDVTEGEVLPQGGVVGAVGSTGNSTGPHLHLELRPAGGVAVDPVPALLAHGVAL